MWIAISMNQINSLRKWEILTALNHTATYIAAAYHQTENFHELLCDLHSENFSFDFIAISEVFECKIYLRLALPGFHELITSCREGGGKQGGVCRMFIKENINYKIREECVYTTHILISFCWNIL